MGEYDSILKEKKKKQVLVDDKPKKFPKFTISFILIILVLVISYIIYYNNVLGKREIFFNNAISILDSYSLLVKDLPLKEFNDDKNLTGIARCGEEMFNFNLVKNNNNLNFNVSSGDRSFNYFLVDDNEYANVNSVTSNITVDYSEVVNLLFSVDDKFLSIGEDKYVKSFYFDGVIPIVEVNLVMDTNYINELFKLGLKDDYQVIVTMKNSAIMNEIKEIKIVINNLSKNDRRVVFVSSNEILYKTKNNIYKFVLEKNNKDFVIKINKGDILYSILTGTANDNSYKYSYQVIDGNYSIDINASTGNNIYVYEIEKKQNGEEKAISVTVSVNAGHVIDGQFDTFVDMDDESIKNIYNQEFGYFKDKFLDFIN